MKADDREKVIAKLNARLNAEGLEYFQALQGSNLDWSSMDAKSKMVARREILEDLKPIGISYSKKTGIGFAGKRFQFIVGEPEANVFAKLYENMNTQLDNKTVLTLIGKEPRVGNRSRAVTELAKKLREVTGISSRHLTANKGTLTMMGIKLPPKPISP